MQILAKFCIQPGKSSKLLSYGTELTPTEKSTTRKIPKLIPMFLCLTTEQVLLNGEAEEPCPMILTIASPLLMNLRTMRSEMALLPWQELGGRSKGTTGNG